jgi:hypothetical protein
MPIADDRVIFISGCGHSGTTVLSAIMDSHPKIYTVRRETNWFNNYQCNDLIIRQEYEFEKNKEETQFFKKEIILEKTANHIFSVPLIRKYFPNSQHIFIVRNPLDTCASLYCRYNDIDMSVDRWNNANYFVLTHAVNDWAHMLRYEDLVTTPGIQLTKICQFLNIEYSNDMLSYYQTDISFPSSDPVIIKRNKQIKQPLTNHNGGYRSIFSQHQIDYVLEKTRKISQILGY